MPELPDVEGFCRTVEEHGLGRRIDHVTVHDQKVLAGVSPQRLRDELQGRRLQACDRHGKRLAVALEGGGWIDLHFGMTGRLVPGASDDEEPTASRVQFVFDDGTWLAFDCRRKLGRVGLHDGEPDLAASHDLGPDALELARDDFVALVCGQGGGLKSVLMDQSLIAGIGNVYADEICFRAKLHPRRKAAELSPTEARRLHTALRDVLELAAERGGDPEQLPKIWLLRIRNNERADCPRCGTRLADERVNGRRTRSCPNCQGLGS